MKIIKEIERFHKDRLLDKEPYDDINELSMIFEEMLEILGYDIPKSRRQELKQKLKLFIEYLVQVMGLKKIFKDPKVDGYADIIVIAIGSILKLGYEPTGVLDEVQKHVNSRVGSIINGKFEKDESKKHLWYEVNYDKCKRK